MKRKPQASASRARLQVLAAADAKKFRELVGEMLASPQRLDREAALEALVERPDSELRLGLRDLYFALNADGIKRDQGAIQRIAIIKVLRSIRDSRDVDVGVAAIDAREVAFGEDIAWELRVHGLLLLAEIAPDVFPYYAIEHLDDMAGPEESEPASTAFQLLAGTGNDVALYQWLLRSPGGETAQRVFELFIEKAPPEIVQRYATSALTIAIKREDDALCTVLVESIVRLELQACYPALAAMMFAKISDELYAYAGMLLAGTNRTPLLAILEDQLHRGRRPKLIAEALRVRNTPEQEAILQRWEDG
ncbi:MAG: hypothetical protein WD359_08310 [Dehalococcoidia bacterium]